MRASGSGSDDDPLGSDGVLSDVAVHLQSTVRVTDHVGRLGRNRLTAALVETDVDRATSTAQRFLERARSAHGHHGEPLPVLVSLRPLTPPDCDPQAALVDAVSGLHQAESEGGLVVVATPDGGAG